ncbi:prolipoprotein diacylglyceryl transferase [Fonticella tunisiensis]|uniref:Phosphatidylglycerol--prolipoprotein diacylglyceryl transferase n=1 Tax=Fonticella tunisiensis TaxID=1096341 RepID=A0A4R7KTK6_9CLOT|nr:prolipoprotein diacylglyceryl transferase [Fonticella tunisiensis]TDT63447.1 prolipoprotein diacylglyceryl transferase [Fonticella tunisiensis]
MNPIAFSIFGIGIRWYGILIASGMLIGILIASHTSRIKGISYDRLLDILLISIPAGIIGARLYYVIFKFDLYRDNLADIFNIRQGGLAIHGGLIFGILAAYLYTRYKNINLIKYADVAAPSIIIAQAIGRWGNFFNQEAHGDPVSSEFISHFPEFIQKGMFIEGQYWHPTFLYESLWNLVVFFILLIILRRSKRDGTVLFSYIGLYSIGRFFIEGLRTDSLMVGPLRAAQLVSLAGIIGWIGFLIYSYRRRERHI